MRPKIVDTVSGTRSSQHELLTCNIEKQVPGLVSLTGVGRGAASRGRVEW